MSFRLAAQAFVLSILGTLASCALVPGSQPSAGVETRPVGGVPPVATATPLPPLPPLPRLAGEPEHPHARWVPASFAELPGWADDRTSEIWPALRQGCVVPMRAWVALCGEALRWQPRDDLEARQWMEQRLAVFRLESDAGEPQGLATGYFEPLIEARRKPAGAFRTPLWGPPAGYVAKTPWFTRQEIDQRPDAQAALRGREVGFVTDPLDALLLQVQGSGRVRMKETDGTERIVRVTNAGTNEQGYRSVARWLVDQGELRLTEASWPAIRDWVKRNPQRRNELLYANPRVVWLREEPLPNPAIGPRGAQGAPLTPGRSIAVDPASVPYGSAVWLDTTEPLSTRPLQRAVMAQDTGSAIVGPVRADYFWGWGGDAEAQAGRMKQPLRMWVLWPRA